jgi:ABC-2 type transport system permease protein
MTTFTGLRRYTGFIARRERSIGTIWLVCLVVATAGIALAYPGLFPNEADMAAMAAGLNTPAMIAMTGPIYGLDNLSPALMFAQQCLLWLHLTMGVMNIFFVSRHTRDDEEQGRLEMLRSLPVGRLTNAGATLMAALGLNLAVGLLSALGLLAVQVEGTTVSGALALGLSCSAVGCLFAALTLVTAQLFSTTRGTIGWAFAALGVFEVLRASGDMQNNALSYISPLGVGLRIYTFDNNNYWPILVLMAEAVVLAAIGLAICRGRDLGEGVISARAGRKQAQRSLLSPFGLAWRLTNKTVLAWGVVALGTGLAYGAVLPELNKFLASNGLLSDIVGASGGNTLVDNFLAMLFAIMGLLALVPVILAVTKIRNEEKRGRLEQVYATAVSRTQLFSAYIGISLIQSVVFTGLGPLGLYAGGSSAGLDFGQVMLGSLCYLPALWAIMGLTACLVGLAPRLAVLVWAYFTYAFFVTYFGRLLNIPEWLPKTTPYGWIPQVPVAEFSAWPLLALTVIAAALTAGGVVTYGRRDIG